MFLFSLLRHFFLTEVKLIIQKMSINTKIDTPLNKNASSSSSVRPNNEFTLNDLMKKLQQIETSQDGKCTSIKDELSKYETKLSVLNDTLEGTLTSINSLKIENDNLKSEVNCLSEKVSSFESNNLNKNLSSEDMILEAQHRIIKSRHTFIFNKAELPNEINNETLAIANELIDDLNLNINIIHAKRIGRKHTASRPILLQLENESIVLDKLKSKSKLRSLEKLKNVLINSDLTKTQQNNMKLLREELRQKLEAGSTNLIINM